MIGNHRVLITGMGIVSPLGLDVATTWDGIVNGRSGVDFITAFDSEAFDTHFAAEVKGFEPENYLDRKVARRMDRFAQFASVAAQQACLQAGLEPGSIDQSHRPIPHRRNHRQRHRRYRHPLRAA